MEEQTPEIAPEPPKNPSLKLPLTILAIVCGLLCVLLAWALTRPQTTILTPSATTTTESTNQTADTSANKAFMIGYPYALQNKTTLTNIELMPGTRIVIPRQVSAPSTVLSDSFVDKYNDILGYFIFSSALPEGTTAQTSTTQPEAENYILVVDSTQWQSLSLTEESGAPSEPQFNEASGRQAWIKSLYSSRDTKSCDKVPKLVYDTDSVSYIETADGVFSGCIRTRLSGPQAAVYNPYLNFNLVGKFDNRDFLITGNYRIIDKYVIDGTELEKIPEADLKNPSTQTKAMIDAFTAALKTTKVELKPR